ncbi:Tn3 family transposase [Streptosporangium amethystogenes]|uniref:Tn3 family transposase n=1 Tax=Streptosporangium amethystogenes TaxID=2002 RepID=UPI003CCBA8BB
MAGNCPRSSCRTLDHTPTWSLGFWNCWGSPTGRRWRTCPTRKGWRISSEADYGPLNTLARGKIDLRKVRRNWEDILRVVASIYTGTVPAYDVVTMLQRDGYPTALGEAIAAYGRIFKSLQCATRRCSVRTEVKDHRRFAVVAAK